MRPLAKGFYLKLFIFWLTWVGGRTFLLSVSLCTLATFVLYASQGFAPLSSESILALKTLFLFFFPIFFSVSFILYLLLVFKALFFKVIEGKKIQLYDCQDQRIEKPLLSEVIPIWRKWLFFTLWAILLFLVVFIGLYRLISGELPSLNWINARSVYALISLFGGAVFVLGVKRCKKIRVLDV